MHTKTAILPTCETGVYYFFPPLFVLIIVMVISLFHCLHLLSARLLKLVHVLQPFNFLFFFMLLPVLEFLLIYGCCMLVVVQLKKKVCFTAELQGREVRQ